MAVWNRKKILSLAKGFKGRSKNCKKLALRKVFKKLQYAYRDRRVKKRIVRRDWIHCMNAALREMNLNYSRFAYGMQRSNIELDRKILAELAVNEPFSFKSVVSEMDKQFDLKGMMK